VSTTTTTAFSFYETLTKQLSNRFQMPQLIDIATPDSAKTRKGFDGQDYELVFSDEFEIDGRTFFPGDDPYWEAVDLSYRATADLEWYHPNQITTKSGKLSILMENVANHGMQYRSGMLQSWNKFCFVSGYIEVLMTLPGPNQETTGYVSLGAICFVCFAYFLSLQWPGAWTMGNLGRPGYGASTDGIWPYSCVPSSSLYVDSFVYSFPVLAVTTPVMSVRFQTRHSEMALAPPQRSTQMHRVRTTTSSCRYYQASDFRELSPPPPPPPPRL
jgi:Beta-glucan synthesis-associated protein SKN1/KRE6/Sbg1